MKKKLVEYCTITCDPAWFESLAINTGYIGSPDTAGYLIPAADAERRDRLSAAKDAVCEAAREVADETGDKGHTAPPLGSLVKLYGMLEALDKLDKVQE